MGALVLRTEAPARREKESSGHSRDDWRFARPEDTPVAVAVMRASERCKRPHDGHSTGVLFLFPSGQHMLLGLRPESCVTDRKRKRDEATAAPFASRGLITPLLPSGLDLGGLNFVTAKVVAAGRRACPQCEVLLRPVLVLRTETGEPAPHIVDSLSLWNIS